MIVIRSTNFWTKSTACTYEWIKMTKTTKVAHARQKRKIRYLFDYFWKTFSCYLGNRMILTSCPFVVTKFVLTTHTGIPYYFLNYSNLDIAFLSFTWIMVVP